MFTRQQHEAIAEVFRTTQSEYCCDSLFGGRKWWRRAHQTIAERIGLSIEKDDSRFDLDKFLIACGCVPMWKAKNLDF